jgi:hypothetical protein
MKLGNMEAAQSSKDALEEQDHIDALLRVS